MIILTVIAIITAIVMQERIQVTTHTVIAIAMQARIQVITHTVIAIVTVIAMQAKTQVITHTVIAIVTVIAMQTRTQAKTHIVTAIVILTITRINRNVTIDSVKKKYINNAEIAHMVWKPYGFSSYNIVKM